MFFIPQDIELLKIQWITLTLLLVGSSDWESIGI